MLFREYNVRTEIGNEEFPFCICNAKLNECRRLDYIDRPNPEELEAPALEIIPLSEDVEGFYSQFSTDYIDENGNDIPVGDEVMKAMRGQSGEWKVIRCCVVSNGLIFVVVNPVVCASGVQIEVNDALYGTYEADLKEGKVYIWLNRRIIRSANLKVKVKKYQKSKLKTFRKYRIAVRAGRVEFTEYYKHFKRISDINCEADDSYDNKIHVTEIYD